MWGGAQGHGVMPGQVGLVGVTPGGVNLHRPDKRTSVRRGESCLAGPRVSAMPDLMCTDGDTEVRGWELGVTRQRGG